ncbi:methylglutaconyl-CoA hydratase [Roseibium hamelinense]|uniref:Methylglutaconyl-CoA hydratase n=1 Tax=Roseibium hamelinense TaxID=150831 RepID=A0A562SF10_9HYPH|nr:crotonase/enoyl-CoA hydratase family protein [Roseibium hamelinense]MTI42887.1 crotonase/enoyl-CoA hydratase family protein [Roseibium hamelinense]TWI79919.1 methylglutaconyl-CoA hydratase [Roseibium hamelinense]
MTFETIHLAVDKRGVAALTLNRPDKHNAMSAQMIEELTAAASFLAEDASVRVVILTGSGKSFCAGGDLGWMREQFVADRATRMHEARKLAMMLKTLNELPKPLIGKVQGQAFGGGVGLLSVCDTVVAVDTAKFGLTEVRLGLIPATISPYVLARMGEGKARRVFMSARVFDAAEARNLDLVARVVRAEELDGAVEAETEPYFAASPAAVAASKRLARSLGPQISNEVIDSTIEQLANAWETADAKEGVSAFFEKRTPAWTESANASQQVT